MCDEKLKTVESGLYHPLFAISTIIRESVLYFKYLNIQNLLTKKRHAKVE